MYVKWKILLIMAIVFTMDAFKETFHKKGEQCYIMLYY